jgi:hypothetical protein
MRSRRQTLQVLFVAILASSSISAFAANRQEQINQDLLNSDVAMIHRTKSSLDASSAQGADFDNFLKLLSPSDVRDNRDLGCGIRQFRMACYGGYTTIWVNAAAIDKKLVALECVQSGSSSTWSRIEPDLEKAWGKAPLKKDDSSITISTFVDRKLIDAATSREFGVVKVATPPAPLDEPFSFLMSPLEETHVGEVCYYEGTKPAGRKALEKLVDAGRFDLIRAVLRGPSPEGRAYAALALNRDSKATPEDLAVEDKLKKLNIKIAVCHGCIVSTEPFTEVLMEKHLEPANPPSSKSRQF